MNVMSSVQNVQIDNNNAKKRRSNGSGCYRSCNKKLKCQGKAYTSSNGKEIAAKSEPPREVVCKCQYSCKKITYERKLELFKSYYETAFSEQGTYLMGLINLASIQRRRHGTYESPKSSRRQCSIYYNVPDGNGHLVHVCKRTFREIFAITAKRIEVLVKKKEKGVDRRKGNKTSKFTEDDRQQVKNHILLLPRDVSHYSRLKSKREYLSPDLNLHRLHKAFLVKYPDSSVTYKYYRRIFFQDFPNLSFHRPRVDTCRTCDKFNFEIQAQISSSKSAKTQLELHHRKVQNSLAAMKDSIMRSQQPGSTCSVISMDLQQVMFVPTLTHSDMFYLSQLSCYNFGVHLSDTNTSFMCMWHEGVRGRGGNEIASCLLRVLNMDVTHKRNLIIWSDNCAGQNKNKMVVYVMLFLVSNGVFDTIQQNFLTSGHSFMACDRDFALIEKRKRVMKSFVPNDLHEVVKSAKYNPPFAIVNMEKLGFFNISNAADEVINTKTLNISRVVQIRIDSRKPGKVLTKETFNDLEDWKETVVLKKGKTTADLKGNLTLLAQESKITDNKKKSLASMIPYLRQQEHKEFYRKLLNIE